MNGRVTRSIAELHRAASCVRNVSFWCSLEPKALLSFPYRRSYLLNLFLCRQDRRLQLWLDHRDSSIPRQRIGENEQQAGTCRTEVAQRCKHPFAAMSYSFRARDPKCSFIPRDLLECLRRRCFQPGKPVVDESGYPKEGRKETMRHVLVQISKRIRIMICTHQTGLVDRFGEAQHFAKRWQTLLLKK